jgi:IPT/TIG domain
MKCHLIGQLRSLRRKSVAKSTRRTGPALSGDRRDGVKHYPNLKRTAGVAEMTIKPEKGSTAGGDIVSITGGPWDEETLMFTDVTFGDCAASRVDPGDLDTTSKYPRYKSIKATSPPHEKDKVPVTVATPDGSEPAGQFEYQFTISNVNPPKAAVPKEKIVVVAITGDDLANVEWVKFGNKNALFGPIDPNDPKHIWAVVPHSEAPGTVDVLVKTPHGENTDNPAKFEYT